MFGHFTTLCMKGLCSSSWVQVCTCHFAAPQQIFIMKVSNKIFWRYWKVKWKMFEPNFLHRLANRNKCFNTAVTKRFQKKWKEWFPFSLLLAYLPKARSIDISGLLRKNILNKFHHCWHSFEVSFKYLLLLWNNVLSQLFSFSEQFFNIDVSSEISTRRNSIFGVSFSILKLPTMSSFY